jgi:long-chain acyl-CoA synthetase
MLNLNPRKSKKYLDWAIEVGREFRERKRNGETIPLAALSLKHKAADKLVFSKLRERTGGRIRFMVSGGAALPTRFGSIF